MKWRNWKVGCVASILMSLFVAGSGLTGNMGWRSFIAVFCTAAVTHFGAFIYQNPADKISFDTSQITKQDKP